MDLYPRQVEVLDAIASPGAVAFKSCNEGGKTSRIAVAAILWHLARFQRGKIVSTSGSFRQIEDQLVPALRRFEAWFPNWGWDFHKSPKITTKDPNGFYVGFSTNDARLFEGFHADGETAPLLIILDEAKSIGTDIFQAVDRCKATRVLVMSSCGLAQGEFYDAFTRNAKHYSRFSQRASDCPHWKCEAIATIRDKWKGSPEFAASMLDAEFMTNSEEMCISLAAVDALAGNPPKYQPGQRKAFCDFAGGGDENACALRDGNRVTLLDAWRDANTMAACGRFIGLFRANGLTPEEIEGDASGMGSPMIDRLAEMGWPIHRCYSGKAALDERTYFNRGAEMWLEGGEAIKKRSVIITDDAELRGQLTTRKRTLRSDGRLWVETKDEMAKRGIPSPDRADAVLGAMADLPRVRGLAIVRHDDRRPWDDDDGDTISDEVFAGFNAGM